MSLPNGGGVSSENCTFVCVRIERMGAHQQKSESCNTHFFSSLHDNNIAINFARNKIIHLYLKYMFIKHLNVKMRTRC